jgi:multidrug efflux pump subunit AcrA (membrane-fusion protein)
MTVGKECPQPTGRLGDGIRRRDPDGVEALRLSVGDQPDVLMAPQVALGSSQLGQFLYVIGKDGTVEQRMVTIGRTDGDQVAVLTAWGDLVISGNLQDLAGRAGGGAAGEGGAAISHTRDDAPPPA